MPWSNYDFNQSDPLFEGQVSSAYPNGIRAYINNILGTVFPWGRMAVLYPQSGVTENRSATLPSLTTGLVTVNTSGYIQLGITRSVQVFENDQDPNSNYGYPINRPIDVVAKGEIAVVSEVAVNVGDPVYYRTVSRTGFTNFGAFRNNSDNYSGAYYCDLVLNATWIKGAVAGGIGVVAINLP